MHIAYLSSSTIPSRSANSVHVMKMCDAFATHGHDVTLYCYSGGKMGAIDDDYSYYGIRAVFRVVKRPLPRARVLGTALYAYWLAVQMRKNARPELIYARSISPLMAVSRLHIPMVLEVHDVPTNWRQRLALSWLVSQSHFRRLVAISHALRQEYASLFPRLSDQRVLVAHDGADTWDAEAELEQPAPLPGRTDAFRVGYTGHLYPGKGMEIISAVAALMPEVDFYVVGGTEQDIARWKAACKEGSVYFLGHVAHSHIHRLCRQFDVVLAPYQEHVAGAGGGDIARWMSPLKIFEYMALGKAIVCSNLPVLREVLADGTNALLVPPSDATMWAEAIARLRDDPNLRRRLGEAARHDLATRYTWRRRATMVLAGLE